VQIDIGFGDRVTPAPEYMEYPTILDGSPTPCIQIYPPETIIAEKAEAVISLYLLNSRLKDYFDIWFLSETMSIDGLALSKALKGTFEHRKTALRTLPGTFFDEFNSPQNRRQWEAMKGKALNPELFPELSEAFRRFQLFVSPVLETLSSGQEYPKTWHPETRVWT